MKLFGLDKKINIHFIGIGGISMSSLAEICRKEGCTVTGSDINSTPITDHLESIGIDIAMPQCAENIKNPDIVVYTAAISKDNPEYKAAKSSCALVVERSVFLGELMKAYKHNCCISGTHGKTTTTSMVALIMIEAKKDPTVTVGGVLKDIGGNLRIGSRDMFVTESCEYVGSFLEFFPETCIINNIEEDHLDYFKDIEDIKNTFRKFALLVPSNGLIIANGEDKNVIDCLKNVDRNIKYFGAGGDFFFRAENTVFDSKGIGSYDFYAGEQKICRVELSVPGRHNVLNSLAAAAICMEHGCTGDDIAKGLSLFKGTDRRFEFKGTLNGADVYDDYAHHPTEIKTTLKTAKNYENRKIIAVFQPHTYTRTKALFNEFTDAFSDADELIVTDIYAAREKDTGLVNSKELAKAIRSKGVNAVYIKDFSEICEYLRSIASSDKLIITIGAGSVCKISSDLCSHN